jgi:hypothetical protein
MRVRSEPNPKSEWSEGVTPVFDGFDKTRFPLKRNVSWRRATSFESGHAFDTSAP